MKIEHVTSSFYWEGSTVQIMAIISHYRVAIFIVQKFQSCSFRQACLSKVFKSHLRGLSNVKTKIPNIASESQICRCAGGVCGYCRFEQQKSPGSVSRLHHVTARGTTNPLHPLLRQWQWCARRQNCLRRRGWLLVAKDSTTNVRFYRAVLYSTDANNARRVFSDCDCSCNCNCIYCGSYYKVCGNDGDQKVIQTATNQKDFRILDSMIKTSREYCTVRIICTVYLLTPWKL